MIHPRPFTHHRLPTALSSRAQSLYAAAGLLLVVGSLTGCNSSKNPFARVEEDYARKVAVERLREIRAIDPKEYSTPADLSRATRPLSETAKDVKSRFDGLESIDLSLEECRKNTLERNLNLKIAVVDPAIASERVSEEDARFNGTFDLRTAWRKFDSPTASQLTAAQSESINLEPSVTIPTRTGGSVSVRLPTAKQETNNQFATLNPAYTSDLEFSISHNLLRNAGRRANTTALRIAGYNQQVSEAQTKLEVIRQLAAVDRAYWRLFQVRAELDVRIQQYELAQAQMERAQRRVNSGAAAEIEVTRAQAGIADSLEAIISSQNVLRLQQRELKRIMNIDGLDVDSTTMIKTATPPDPVEYIFDMSKVCAYAVDNRSEMLQLELQLAADAANISLQRNLALPLFTLDYTYRINGLGGSVRDSADTLMENDFEDWELGLNFQIPLDNEQARSRIRQALLQRIARLNTRLAREQSIRQETLNAIDTIDGTWQRILAARQSVILNTRSLLAEQRQFDVGQSTTTDVLDAATRLADAQSAEVRALTDHQIAQVDLAFATGTLLGAAKVDWEPAPRPRLDDESNDPTEDLSGVMNSPNTEKRH